MGVRVLGLMVAVVGAVLLWSGMKARDSIAEKATELFTGRNTDRTTLWDPLESTCRHASLSIL